MVAKGVSETNGQKNRFFRDSSRRRSGWPTADPVLAAVLRLSVCVCPIWHVWIPGDVFDEHARLGHARWPGPDVLMPYWLCECTLHASAPVSAALATLAALLAVATHLRFRSASPPLAPVSFGGRRVSYVTSAFADWHGRVHAVRAP